MSTKRAIQEITEQIEILSTIAIPREADAHHFYVRLANSNTYDENTRALFIDLAKQEIGHKNTLMKLKEDLISKLAALKADS